MSNTLKTATATAVSVSVSVSVEDADAALRRAHLFLEYCTNSQVALGKLAVAMARLKLAEVMGLTTSNLEHLRMKVARSTANLDLAVNK